MGAGAGKTTRIPYRRLPDGQWSRSFIRNNLHCKEKMVEGRRTYVALDPQPQPEDCMTLCRYYTALKGDVDYRKRVTWVDNAQERSLADVAVSVALV